MVYTVYTVGWCIFVHVVMEIAVNDDFLCKSPTSISTCYSLQVFVIHKEIHEQSISAECSYYKPHVPPVSPCSDASLVRAVIGSNQREIAGYIFFLCQWCNSKLPKLSSCKWIVVNRLHIESLVSWFDETKNVETKNLFLEAGRHGRYILRGDSCNESASCEIT